MEVENKIERWNTDVVLVSSVIIFAIITIASHSIWMGVLAVVVRISDAMATNGWTRARLKTWHINTALIAVLAFLATRYLCVTNGQAESNLPLFAFGATLLLANTYIILRPKKIK